jgi:hypothetical protein
VLSEAVLSERRFSRGFSTAGVSRFSSSGAFGVEEGMEGSGMTFEK